MKAKRTSIDIKDFSGGLVTNLPVTGMDSKYSPDCLNVFVEGTKLKSRKGIAPLNTSTVGVGKKGNGLFNWVRSNTDQLLMAVFDNSLYKMDNSTGWDGTFDAVVADANSGTSFSDSIVHFTTYAGVLLWTTEARDKAQKMTTSDASYKNIESGGSGTSPQGKYIQVWKDHVWIMNIAAGGALTEDCASLSTPNSWDDDDAGAATSTQTSLSGETVYRFQSIVGSVAQRSILIADIPDDYIVETRTQFNTLTATSGSYLARMSFLNGVTEGLWQWSDTTLEVYDGSAYVEVNSAANATDTWAVWKFHVSGGTSASAVVDIQKDNAWFMLQQDMSYANAATNGDIKLTATSGTAAAGSADWYMDYLYLNTGGFNKDYILNPNFVTFTTATKADNWRVGTTTVPKTYFRLEDNAASVTVIDTGATASNGSASVNTSLISTVGVVNNCFSFTSASSHFVNWNASFAAVSANTAGAFSFWFKTGLEGTMFQTLWNVSDSSSDNVISMYLRNSKITCFCNTGGFGQWTFNSNVTISTGSWYNVVLLHDGTTPSMYVNNSLDAITFIISSAKSKWFGALLGTPDRGRLGCQNDATDTNISFLEGFIDDFRYYSSVLGTDEIQGLYNYGSGVDGYSITSADGASYKTSSQAYRISPGGGGASFTLSQTVASSTVISGQACVIGAWVKGEAGDSFKLGVTVDSVDNFSTATAVTDTAFQYKTYEFTPTSGAGTIDARVIYTGASTVVIDHVNLIQDPISGTTPDDNSDRIQRSALTLLDDWDGTDSGTNDIITTGDVGLTGSFILNDKMYVTKSYSLHRITYTGSVPLIDIKQIRGTMGTRSIRTAKNVVIPGSGEVVIFLGTDRRLYMFDGYDTKVLTTNVEFNNNISSIYMKNINAQALDKCFAIVHTDQNWYELIFPLGTSTVPNSSIIFDYINSSIFPFSNRNFRAGIDSDNGKAERVTYVQGNTTGFAYITDSTNSDAGTAINAYWTSPKIGVSTFLGKFDELDVLTNSITTTPSFSWREDFNPIWTTKSMSSGTNKHNWNPGLIDNYIQFKISNNSTGDPFELWQIELLQKGIGYGK